MLEKYLNDLVVSTPINLPWNSLYFYQLCYLQDGSSGEDFGKDSVEQDEQRLTELGRRTVEMFVLTHLYT